MTDYWREECKALEYQLECAKADRDEYWNQRCDAIARAEKAEIAVKHWRCNHDDIVKKLQFATQRLDLPVDRIPAYEAMAEQRDALRAELQRMQSREDAIRQWCDDLFPEYIHLQEESWAYQCAQRDVKRILDSKEEENET